MENAVDALKMAFAVIVFVGALAIAMIVFGQARVTSETILYTRDESNFYEYDVSTQTERIVGLETIIPTLYRYYKENYKVIFLRSDGSQLEIFETSEGDMIGTFDVAEETKRGDPWTSSPDQYKKHLDNCMTGVDYSYIDGSGRSLNCNGIIDSYKNSEFEETMGEYQYEITESGDVNTVEGTINVDGEQIELVKKQTKRIITYTLIN